MGRENPRLSQQPQEFRFVLFREAGSIGLAAQIRAAPLAIGPAVPFRERKHSDFESGCADRQSERLDRVTAERQQSPVETRLFDSGFQQVMQDVPGRSHDIEIASGRQGLDCDFPDRAALAGLGSRLRVQMERFIEIAAVVVGPLRRAGRLQRFQAEAQPHHRFSAGKVG